MSSTCRPLSAKRQQSGRHSHIWSSEFPEYPKQLTVNSTAKEIAVLKAMTEVAEVGTKLKIIKDNSATKHSAQMLNLLHTFTIAIKKEVPDISKDDMTEMLDLYLAAGKHAIVDYVFSDGALPKWRQLGVVVQNNTNAEMSAAVSAAITATVFFFFFLKEAGLGTGCRYTWCLTVPLMLPLFVSGLQARLLGVSSGQLFFFF
jgi:hypothetical protein